MTTGYESIFFDPDWVQPKYFGWGVEHRSEGAQVLKKRYGPVNRWLVSTKGVTDERISSLIESVCGLGPLDEIVLQDFSDEGCESRLFAGRKFTRLPDAQRLMNKATFVIDLREAEETLWAQMSSDGRRKCRNALKSGISVEFHDEYAAQLMEVFFTRYETMAQQRGLGGIDGRCIRQMFAEKDVLLAIVRQGQVIHGMLLVYLTKSNSYFLYGVGGEQRDDNSGRLMHWETIRQLRLMGRFWYDLGGVPEISDSNGIYRFKKDIGGKLVTLGTQYGHRGWPVTMLLAGKRYFASRKSLLAKAG